MVADLYNAFAWSGRTGEDLNPVPLSPKDSANLKLFIEAHCSTGYSAISACQDQQGVDWYTSEHAERFLTPEYYIVRRVLEGREREVLRLSDLSFLSNRLSLFAPVGVIGVSPSLPVGAYFRSLSSVDLKLLGSMDEISWPPANPVRKLKMMRGLSHESLADELDTSIYRVRTLLRGESPLSERVAHHLSKPLEVSVNRCQVDYEMWRSKATLHVESPGKWIVPRPADVENLPKGMAGVVLETRIFSYRICIALLELLRSDRPRIQRCTYCGILYLPKPHSSRHENNYCCDKHRYKQHYDNLWLVS